MTTIDSRVPAEPAAAHPLQVLPADSRGSKASACFELSDVPDEHRARVETATTSLKSRFQKLAKEAYFFGNELGDIKGRLEHGLFVAWVRDVLPFNLRTAERFMGLSRRLGGRIDSVSNLPLTVLYEMTRKAVPDDVLSGLLERAAIERLTAGQVRASLTAMRAAPPLNDDPRAMDLLRSCLAGKEDELADCLTPLGVRDIAKYLSSLINSRRTKVAVRNLN
jgi:hypothetical protein